jgi:class 3 adenylate cyclase
MLQVRFRADQKEEAINEAKLIEKTLSLGVKVVKETYYPADNTCEEVTTYVSQKLSPQEASFSPLGTVNTVRPRGGGPRRGAAGGGAIAEDGGGFRPGKKSRPSENLAGLLFKAVLVIALSVTIAIVCTALVSSLLGRAVVFGVVVPTQYYQNIMAGTFAAVFLLVAVPLLLIFIGGLEGKRRRSKTVTRPVQRKPAAGKGAIEQTVLEERIETTVVVVRPTEQTIPPKGILARMLGQMNTLFGTSREVPVEGPRDRMFGVVVDPEPAPAAPPEETTAVLDEIPGEWTPQNDTPTVVAEQPPIPTPPGAETAPGLDRHRMIAVRFLGDLLGTLKPIRPTLDAYNRFGVDLLMAGAIEALAEHEIIPEAMSRQLLQECVELLGTRKVMAESFCAKVEEYLHEPRYLHLVQAGRDMMTRFQHNTGEPFAGLAQALELWNRPAAKPSAQQIVTVMFTDMVGSTDMTQAKGDAAAQEVVRRHNGIVRQALAEFDGREVKHTGDGIMASFASTANAVDAAIAIQRAVAAHNATAPAIPVHLRIGINAGEPIQEEDDLFGTTVQLAARVCAKAEPEQVLCSNVVRELSQGKGRRFASLGEHDLKGFRDPVALYEVLWLERPAGDATTAAE